MNSLFLDLIIPGHPRRPRPRIRWEETEQLQDTSNNVAGQLDGSGQLADSLNDSGDTVIDTLQQMGDTLQQIGGQMTDTLQQSQSMLIDSGTGGSSSPWLTIAIAAVALIGCLVLAFTYRRRMAMQA